MYIKIDLNYVMYYVKNINMKVYSLNSLISLSKLNHAIRNKFPTLYQNNSMLFSREFWNLILCYKNLQNGFTCKQNSLINTVTIIFFRKLHRRIKSADRLAFIEIYDRSSDSNCTEYVIISKKILIESGLDIPLKFSRLENPKKFKLLSICLSPNFNFSTELVFKITNLNYKYFKYLGNTVSGSKNTDVIILFSKIYQFDSENLSFYDHVAGLQNYFENILKIGELSIT